MKKPSKKIPFSIPEFDRFDAMAATGCLSVFIGLWRIWPPLALISGGSLLIYLAFVLAKKCQS